ncbi:hypothetical protein [Thermodesulfovibrio sp. TK110]
MIRERRKILGSMLFDVVKYLLTAIVITGLFSEKLTYLIVFTGLLLAFIIGIIAFFIIPEDKEE